MKREITILLLSIVLIFCGCNPDPDPDPVKGPEEGGRIVPTTVTKRNVILEEFTGTNCVYCPDGHKIAGQLMKDNSGRLFAINVHGTSLAGTNPDYTTPFANALINQTGLTGVPTGTINRHVFAEGKTILDRNNWGRHAATVMAENSCVNIAAKTTLNHSTRELKIKVEVYYTSDSKVPTNKLNIALLQNNILGPQTGGSNYNPDQMVDDKYKHMHMLRHLITDQWGDEIGTTTKGTFFTKEYTYKVPANYKNVDCVLDDLEVIIFVAEGNQEIITGIKSSITKQ